MIKPRTFILFVIVIALNFIPESILAQSPTVKETLDYLNKKYQDYPWVYGTSDIVYTQFSITSFGELKIVDTFYEKDYQGKTSLSWKRIDIIAIENIDLVESFQNKAHYSFDDAIFLIVALNGSYYHEEVDSKGVQYVKKTFPAQSSSALGTQRNSICLAIGDVGSKQNIINALQHLCNLVLAISDKYPKINRPVDPFSKPITSETRKSDISFENASNKIKIKVGINGLIEIPIILNDVLKIDFIFDSGASEVSLSPDIALTLIKTGTIKDEDWLPSQVYKFANGSTAKSSRFIIRKLSIGNQTLNNIEAGIANSIEAPILIGQNVMQRLGSITIDNQNQLLIINPK